MSGSNFQPLQILPDDMVGAAINPTLGGAGVDPSTGAALARAIAAAKERNPVAAGTQADASAPIPAAPQGQPPVAQPVQSAPVVSPDGSYVPQQATPTPAQAAAGGNQVQAIGNALGNTLAPALMPAPAPAAPDGGRPAVPPAPIQQALQTPAAPVAPSAMVAPDSGTDRNGRATVTSGSGPVPLPTAPPLAKANAALAALPATPQANPTGDYWSSATPPPQQYAGAVQAAAQKYNLGPQGTQALTWTLSHESGWNANVGTNAYGATGLGQFKKATAAQYGIDPSDGMQSIDGAAHYLSDLHAKSGDWTQAVKSYGTFSTGKGAGVDQLAEDGFNRYMGNPVAGPTIAATTAQPVQGSFGGTSPIDAYKPYTPEELKALLPYPNVGGNNIGNQMIALGGGILSGRSLSNGLGKGLTAMAAVGQQGINNQQSMNKDAMALDAQRRQLAQAQTQHDTMLASLGIRQQTANQAAVKPIGQPVKMADGSWVQQMRGINGETTYQPMPGATASGERADFTTSPDQQAAVTQSKDAAKDAQDSIEQLQASRANDTQAMSENAQARALVSQNPTMTGPTLINRANRSLAEMGLTTGASDLQAIQKMETEGRNDYLSKMTGGHLGALRSNAAIKNVGAAVADVNTSPAAADYIMRAQQWDLQSRMDWRNQVQQLASSDPKQITGRNYGTTQDKFMQDWIAHNPVPKYDGPNSPVQGAPTASSSGGGQPSIGSFWK